MAAPVVESATFASPTGEDGSHTFVMPDPSPDGDLYLSAVGIDQPVTLTPPSGWTDEYIDATIGRLGIWLGRRVGASEPATYDVTHTGGAELAASSVVRISGAGGIGVTSSISTGSGTSATAPAITASSAESIILRVFWIVRRPVTAVSSGTLQSASTRDNTGGAATAISSEASPGASTTTGTVDATLTASATWWAATVEILPEGGGLDTTAPAFDTAPAEDTSVKTSTAITVKATATDAVDSTVDHFALLLTNGATYPSSGTQAKSWYDTGAGSNGVLATGTSAGVANGVEGSIEFTSLDPSTHYDEAYFVGDSSGNYNLHTKLDVRTRPALTAATISAAGDKLTFTATESIQAGAGDNGGADFTVTLTNGACTLTFDSGLPGSGPVYNTSRTVFLGETGTVDYTQPGDGLEGVNNIIDIQSFTGLTITNNSTQAGRSASLGASTAIPGATVAVTLSNFSETPTVTVNGVAATYTGTSSSGNVTMPALSTFVAAAAHVNTPWNVNLNVVFTETGGTATDQIQIVAPATTGPTYFSWLADDSPYPADSIFTLIAGLSGVVDGDRILWETVAGTDPNEFLANGSGSYAGDVTGEVRYFDASAGTWSATSQQAFGPDATAPTLSTATVAANGTTLTLAFNEPVTRGLGHADSDVTLSMSGGAATLAYSSGDGTQNLVFTISRPIGNTETGTLAYTQPTDGIQDTTGNDLATIASKAVVNSSTQDLSAPTLSTATIPSTGGTLVLVFNEAVTSPLEDFEGGFSGFALTMSGGAVTVGSLLSGDGTTTLTFDLSRTIIAGETGTLDFVHSDDAVENTSGTDLESISDREVTNDSTADLTAPTLQSATIDAEGTSLTLAFDDTMTSDVGGTGGVTVSLSGGLATATYSSGDGTSSLVYGLSRTVEAGETGTVSYEQPGDGLQDSSGNELLSFSDQEITNSSTADVTAPVLTGASIPSAGTSVVLTFNEAITIGLGGNGGVTLTATDGDVTATYSSGDTTTALTYSTSRTIGSHETVTVSYTQPTAGFQDSDENDVASFSDQPVANGSTQDLTPPTFLSATIAGSQIILTFSEAVQFGAGGSGGFALTASGGAVTMSDPVVDASTITYDLSRTPLPDETITLDYTQPTSGVQDLAENDLATFTDEAVSLEGDTRLVTIFVSDPVPADAQQRAGISYSAAGAMYVANLSGAEVAFLGGKAIRADGALIISTGGSIIATHGGVGLTAVGETVVTTATPDVVHQGIPLTEDGKVCITDAS